MSNPVPPPGGAYPPPPAQGQPGFPPPGQPAFGGQPAPGFPPAPGGQPAQGFPPPAQPGFGQGQPGFGQGQPGFGQGQPDFAPGQPGFPPPGQPGFPAGPEQFGQMPTEQKKSGKRRLVSVLGVVVAVAVFAAIKFGVYRAINTDKAKEAKVGDCVAAKGKVPSQEGKSTEAAAKIVDCTSSDAAYTVVGRVDGETDTNSKSCDKFFTDEKADYFVYSSDSGKGYLLCLKSRKA